MANLGSAHDPQNPDDLIQPGRVPVVQRPGNIFSISGCRTVHGEPGDVAELRRLGHDRGIRQREASTDAGRAMGRAPQGLQRTIRAPRLGEQQEGEVLVAAAKLQPRPAAVLGLRRVAPVQGVAGRLDVVAEALLALAERVDVVAGDVAREQQQRRERHQGGLAGLVRALELEAPVRIPDFGGVVLPEIHHPGPQRLPALRAGGHGETSGGGGISP